MIPYIFSSICLLASSFYYVNAPVVDMRESASNGSKVASQAIYAEEVIIQETSGEWSSIKTPDGYSGWVLSQNLINLPEAYESNAKIARLRAHIYGVKDTEYGPIKSLPYGSKVKVVDADDPRWLKIAMLDHSEAYVQKGDVATDHKILKKSELAEFSQQFLGLPYTWGGRSSFGYDCSAFVQMLYSQMGVNLQRDARQQILDPRLQVVDVDKLESGDLIFFGKSAEKITHVGMYIGDNKFIHATTRENKPWIRISSLSELDWSGESNSSCPYRTTRQLISL